MDHRAQRATEMTDRIITKCELLTLIARLLGVIFALGTTIVALQSYRSGATPTGLLLGMMLAYTLGVFALLEFTLHMTRERLSKLREIIGKNQSCPEATENA